MPILTPFCERTRHRANDLLHPKLQQLLERLRSAIRRYVWLDSLVLAAIVVLAWFWIGFGLDYAPVRLGGTEMPMAARAVLLLIALGALIYVVGKRLIGRLTRDLPDESLALLVEKHHPTLGGRLITAVQLSRPDRTGDAHSQELLAAVHDDVRDSVDRVDPHRVLDPTSIRKKSFLAGGLTAAVLIIAAVFPSTIARAASRLSLLSNDPWPRKARLEMVGIELPVTPMLADATPTPPEPSGANPSQNGTSSAAASLDGPAAVETMDVETKLRRFDDQTIRLPIGSDPVLRIAALADGAIVPDLCMMHFRMADGTTGQTNLRRLGRVRDGYQSFVLDGSPLAGLSQSMDFTIYGLDDRLADYRIIAVPPPIITSTELAIRYPNYLRPADSQDDPDYDSTPDRIDAYASGIRIREGSRVSMRMRASVPLGAMAAAAIDSASGKARSVPPAEIDNGGRDIRLVLDNVRRPTTVALVPRDIDGLSAPVATRYFLGVTVDKPPTLDVDLVGIGPTITPVAAIPLTIKATDDYGLKDVFVAAMATPPNDDPDNDPTPAAPDQKNDATKTDVPEADATVIDLRPQLDRDGNGDLVIDLRSLVESGRLAGIGVGGQLTLAAEAIDGYDIGDPHPTRAERIALEIVSADQLLARLERRELEMRARLEQTIGETTTLRDALGVIRGEISELDDAPENGDGQLNDRAGQDGNPDDDTDAADDVRARSIVRLRIQQSGLQAGKTADELIGVVETIDDILLEMDNNRLDTVDRRERLDTKVARPLENVISGSLAELRASITEIERQLASPADGDAAAGDAIDKADRVILDLTAVLENMLELESFNEILDIVRGLIEDQEGLTDETRKEQKKRILDLF